MLRKWIVLPYEEYLNQYKYYSKTKVYEQNADAMSLNKKPELIETNTNKKENESEKDSEIDLEPIVNDQSNIKEPKKKKKKKILESKKKNIESIENKNKKVISRTPIRPNFINNIYKTPKRLINNKIRIDKNQLNAPKGWRGSIVNNSILNGNYTKFPEETYTDSEVGAVMDEDY